MRARRHFWGLLTGALIASYTLLDAFTVKVVAMSPILFDYWCSILRMHCAAVPVLREIPEAKRLWKLQWKHAAVVIVPVSHVDVAPAREISMFFAALTGEHFLGEGDRKQSLLSAVCLAGGVMALALG